MRRGISACLRPIPAAQDLDSYPATAGKVDFVLPILPVVLLQLVIEISYSAFAKITEDRVANMSALLPTGLLNNFLTGLVSEQINALIFFHDETRMETPR